MFYIIKLADGTEFTFPIEKVTLAIRPRDSGRNCTLLVCHSQECGAIHVPYDEAVKLREFLESGV